MVLTHDRPSSGFDVSLVRRACAGDAEAFGVLMERHADPVRRLVRRFVRDGDDARDVEQDTWIRAASNLGSLADADRFQPWVKAIARNASLNYLSSRKRLGAHVTTFEVLGTEDFEDEASPTPEAAVLSKDSQQKVWQALGVLSERDRIALFLREYKGLPYSEIAAELGVSRNAAEVCAHRARERFRLAFTTVDADVPECGVDGLRLSTLLEPAEGVPLAARLELEGHLDSCGDCERRLAAMTEGRTLYRNLGGFGLPIPGAGLFGWAGDLLAKLGHLLGLTSGAATTTAAGGSTAGAAATAGAAVATGTSVAAAGIGGAISATALAATAAAVIVIGAVTPSVDAPPSAPDTHMTASSAVAAPTVIRIATVPAAASVAPAAAQSLRDAEERDEPVGSDAATAGVIPPFQTSEADGLDAAPPPARGGTPPSLPAFPESTPAATQVSPQPTVEVDPPVVTPTPPESASVEPPPPPPGAPQAPPEKRSTIAGAKSAPDGAPKATPGVAPVQPISFVPATVEAPGKGPNGTGAPGRGLAGDGPPAVGLAAGIHHASSALASASRESGHREGPPAHGAPDSGPPRNEAPGNGPRGNGP